MATKKTFFPNTMKDIANISPILENMLEQAIELGASAKNLNLVNAWAKCDKALRSYSEANESVLELGYSSLPIALKALKQFKKQEAEVDITNLPEVFHKPAAIWLTGKPANKAKGEKGFAPLRVREAELQHRGVLPWLLEAWAMADIYENGDDVRDELLNTYLSTTPDDFTRLCYMRINDMEEPDLEVELNSHIEKASSVFERARALRALEEIDYGVGGILEPPTWD